MTFGSRAARIATVRKWFDLNIASSGNLRP
jgi:hypothetical protein